MEEDLFKVGEGAGSGKGRLRTGNLMWASDARCLSNWTNVRVYFYLSQSRLFSLCFS